MTARRHVLDEKDMDFLFRGGAIELPDGQQLAMQDIGTDRLVSLLDRVTGDCRQKAKLVNLMPFTPEQRRTLPKHGPIYLRQVAIANVIYDHEFPDAEAVEKHLLEYFRLSATILVDELPDLRSFAIVKAVGAARDENRTATRLLRAFGRANLTAYGSAFFVSTWPKQIEQLTEALKKAGEPVS